MRIFNIKRIFISLIFIGIIGTALFISETPFITADYTDDEDIVISRQYPYTPMEKTYVDLRPDELHSYSAILIRLHDDKIFIDKNKKHRTYPASLTKIMTVIVAIEELDDLDLRIRLDESIFPDLYLANASLSGFLPGEQVKAIDLLYGAMLLSGAESCIGLANEIAGSEEEFVGLMNSKAKELEMFNTHFMNTTGLHHDYHYSSVEDMSKLLKYALNNETFTEIFNSSTYTTEKNQVNPEGRTFNSTMTMKLGNQRIFDGEFLGGKTGYTGTAGLCLASLSLVDGEEYMLITVGAQGSLRTEQFNISDALTVYNNIKKSPIN